MSEETGDDGVTKADEMMAFSLTRKEVKFEVEVAPGDKRTWSLVELTGDERDQWLQDMGKRLDAKGQVSNFIGLQATLLVKAVRDEAGKPVDYPRIKAMPAAMQSALFAKAQDMNALSEKGRDEAKKA